ncbi:GTP-binding protein [Martelella sp. HB161492]|uniref:CobW family GTP-binding protein n=1 Tax=Martelella sp. HB161492 TaxID=2720726 RepID=UPI001FED42C6|nr:GTP-binding protein [Martelella sp. HB161492]
MKQFYDPIPVTLLTGYLGAGKTSLINMLVSDQRMAAAAVIVNEFGDVAIDHDLIRQGSERYFRTTTGCLCCTATSEIRVSLFELHEAYLRGDVPPISRVVIETTGLADPAPIINSLIPGGAPALGLRDHVVARHFYLEGVMTAFDALHGRATLDAFLEGWKQLAFADHVILTKTDLCDVDRDLVRALSVLNPVATFHDRHAKDFDLVALLGSGRYSPSGKSEDVIGWLAMEGLNDHDDHSHDPNRHGDEIMALSLTSETPLTPQGLTTFLKVLTEYRAQGLLRLKGIVQLSDDLERPMVVHAVQHRLDPLVRLDGWPGEDHRTRLVLIGIDLPERQIRELFAVIIAAPRKKKRV